MKPPSFEILMGTKNGERWLGEQLLSFSTLRNVRWRLSVSDDQSSDKTREILRQFKAASKQNSVRIKAGPNRGFAKNYLSLLKNIGRDPDFVALSDQDDIWRPGRLARAARMLGSPNTDEPRVYASRSREFWDFGHDFQPSTILPESPVFGRALFQNLLAGNTIVMNQPAAQIVRKTIRSDLDIPFHDWWIFLVLSGAGAKIILDNEPSIYYRQHQKNLIGAHRGAQASVRRLRQIASGEYARWLAMNINALDGNRHCLTFDAQSTLDHLKSTFESPHWARAFKLWQGDASRQSRLENICLYSAATFGRL